MTNISIQNSMIKKDYCALTSEANYKFLITKK